MSEVPRRGAARPALAVLCVLGALTVAACAGSDGGTRSDNPTTVSESSGGDDLLTRLRAGGTVIVIRHAATDRSQQDADERPGSAAGPVDFDDCATQRNLTEEGRADARAIGTAVRDLDIPVGAVWASPYCRSRETADLAFGGAEVVPGLERLYPERDADAERSLNQLIQDRAPAAGDPNLIIAGHGVYPSVLQPAVTLGEGDAAVYSVRSDGVAFLGQLSPDEWAALE